MNRTQHKKVIIKVLDSTYISLNDVGVDNLREELSYTAVYYTQQGYRKVRKEYQKSMINKQGITQLGFVPRIKEFCFARNIPLEIEDEYRLTRVSGEGKIKRLSVAGKVLREDQKALILQSLRSERGVLKAPTGTGKTVMMMGLMSCYPQSYRWLLFVPTLSILEQTNQELLDHGFTKVLKIGGKNSHVDYSTEELVEAKVILTTASSFLNLLQDRGTNHWHDCLDAVLVDECHIGMKPEGRYDKIFKQLLAPIRIGFTATLPNDTDALLSLEGVLGPVIAEMSLQKAADLDLLAKPKLKMLVVPKNTKLAQEKDYHSVVDKCLVTNEDRNNLIVRSVKQLKKRNLSVIVFVTKIEHGKILSTLLEESGIGNLFIRGDTAGIDREEIRQQMITKKVQCVIATVVWREGVNIPSLNAAILAGGGKTTSGILQSIGRALRKTKDKKKALVIDFLDPYKYLAEHTVERMSIYAEQGWI